MLRDVLDKLGVSRPPYQRVLSLHETSGWAYLVEAVIFLGWAILQQAGEKLPSNEAVMTVQVK